MNAWNLEDDITRIGSKAEDYLSGVRNADSSASETDSRWKAKPDENGLDPFRQFQTSPPNRILPTPLADLYSQSIDQAEVNSESWGATQHTDYVGSPFEDEYDSQCLKEVEFMPEDLFSFSKKQSTGSFFDKLKRSIIAPKDEMSFEDASFSTEESLGENTPKLLETTKKGTDRQMKRPLLSLSVGISICGVGLVFGSQIMHNAALVSPGKSLIIAGLIGLFVSAVSQTFKLFGRRKTA